MRPWGPSVCHKLWMDEPLPFHHWHTLPASPAVILTVRDGRETPFFIEPSGLCILNPLVSVMLLHWWSTPATSISHYLNTPDAWGLFSQSLTYLSRAYVPCYNPPNHSTLTWRRAGDQGDWFYAAMLIWGSSRVQGAAAFGLCRFAETENATVFGALGLSSRAPPRAQSV